jgi:O-antigen/teichoic acid export membrane protein
MNADLPEPGRAEAIGRHAAHGVMWTYLSFAGSKVLIFAATVVLARVLIPSEFGQVGFALLVIGYIETVGDFGISSALIYERDRPEEAANVAFIVSVVAGLFWFAAAYAAAPFVAGFFNDPMVVPIMRAMSFSFVINALGNTHDAILRRDLAFKKRLLPDFSMALVKGLISVALALAGWGVWSLVWGQLIGAAAATIALWRVVPWRPGLKASWEAARKMLTYGGHIVAVNVVSAIVHDADFLIVGRMLGAAALGLYSLAYRTPELLITTVIWVIGKVTFPVYSKLREDPGALANAFLVTLRYLSLITLPAGFGLAFLGAGFVTTFYGESWVGATLAMQALAVSGALRSLGSHAGDVYKAIGRPNVLTKLGLLRAAVLIPAMIWGARYGIFGVALAQMVVTGASTVLNLVVAARILALPGLALIREFRTGTIGTTIMVAVLALAQPLQAALPAYIALALEFGLGALVYLGTVAWIDRPAIRQVRAAFANAGGPA